MLTDQKRNSSKMKLVSLVNQMKSTEKGDKKKQTDDPTMGGARSVEEGSKLKPELKSLSRGESVRTLKASTKRNSIVPAFQQTLKQCASSGNHQISAICPASVFLDYKKLKKETKKERKYHIQPYPRNYHPCDFYEMSKLCPSMNFNSRRLVFKNGDCNVNRANIKKRRQRYMADIFTTLIDIKWRWNLLNFVLAFMLSWFIFALLWWLIAFSHGDFNLQRSGERACVEDVQDFTTALLFSIETQQTIGYGSRHTNSHCSEAILVMMFQSCFGVIIQALMTGLVFAKLSRPKKRAETLLFSKNALICKRDGQICLVFRVGDMRKSHIVEAHVRAILIKKRVTREGEVIPLSQIDLKLGDGESEGRLFMVWPVIVEHRINEDSPFWTWSAEDLKREKFELVVVLEGIVESTGMTTQARTSYLPEEIMWGYRFERLVNFDKESGQYLIDYSRFHLSARIDIPKCSAKDLAQVEEEQSLDSESSSEQEEEDKISYGNVFAASDALPTHSPSINKAATENKENTIAPMRNLLHSDGIAQAAMKAFELDEDDDDEEALVRDDDDDEDDEGMADFI